jgi:molecular chaperone GrpE (heat shock protein)
MQAMNGNGEQAAMGDDERARQMVEEGLNAVARIQQERDNCAKQLQVTGSQLRGAETELAALNLAYQRLLGEIETYRRERDLAVARRAEVEAVFNAALQILMKYRTPTVAEENTPQKETPTEVVGDPEEPLMFSLPGKQRRPDQHSRDEQGDRDRLDERGHN